MCSISQGDNTMNKPILVVMAAGMGSRYGGLKQIDPVGPNGEIIIDYSLSMPKKQALKPLFLSSRKKLKQISKPL